MAGVSAVRRLPVVKDLTLVTAGAMTANVAGYLLQLLASRWLGVSGYSGFASLLAVQMLCAVPALALQNVVAREVVRGAPVHAARALTLRCAGLVAAAALLLIPAVALGLKVSVIASAGALCSAPMLVVLAGEQGIQQGRSKFRELATVLGGAAVLRVLPAVVVLACGSGTAPTLWAAAAGTTLAAVIARKVSDAAVPVRTSGVPGPGTADRPTPRADNEDSVALGGDATDSVTPGGDAHGMATGTVAADGVVPGTVAAAAVSAVGGGWGASSGVGWGLGVAAVFRAVQVQAALTALSQADLLIARMVLDENDAGRYALGAIATKIAFWLPQAVGVVLYPRMAQPQHSARAMRSALAVLVGIGGVTVAGAAIAAPLAPLFAGRDYAPIEGLLWLFALEGALLAVLQAALLSAIATDRTAPAAITWIGLGAGVAAMLTCAHSVLSLIVVATATAAATTLVIIGVAWRAARDGADRPSPVPDLGAGGT
ncbi:polysaccharide biosynthesis protein [Nocardia yunnanensis]|uniref:Polysaccharide biosynthesis protein n=1 Tax=Nocardia yunnanensis TaxID=2382165 RepID=A0A386ZR93_9NOCA|nr:polysaccharide biosynthesis protein [Nocardia yunnanensis]AYF79259.1 polysaccharide biosynthesis protein [Nocardia yunnanensis]